MPRPRNCSRSYRVEQHPVEKRARICLPPAGAIAIPAGGDRCHATGKNHPHRLGDLRAGLHLRPAPPAAAREDERPGVVRQRRTAASFDHRRERRDRPATRRAGARQRASRDRLRAQSRATFAGPPQSAGHAGRCPRRPNPRAGDAGTGRSPLRARAQAIFRAIEDSLARNRQHPARDAERRCRPVRLRILPRDRELRRPCRAARHPFRLPAHPALLCGTNCARKS